MKKMSREHRRGNKKWKIQTLATLGTQDTGKDKHNTQN